MMFLVGGRQSGITTSILLKASKNKEIIIVASKANVIMLQKQCEQIGINPPQIFSYGEIEKGKARGLTPTTVNFDNLDYFLQDFLSQNGIYGTIGTIGCSIE